MPTPLQRPLRIGTRGSPLALAQARMVADALRIAHQWGEEAIEIVPITTSGDMIQDRPLAELGGKALWTKELDRCLADGRTDLSVHSMKDVETIRPDAFLIGAYLPREDTSDRLVGAASLDDLPEGAVVGTSSPRRKAQLLARRPDLDVVAIRGNVQTRLGKIGSEVQATLLASAGLKRLGMDEVGTPLAAFLPAPAQGAIGVEICVANQQMIELVAPINDGPTGVSIEAERAFLAALGGNCRSAVAALATGDAGALTIEAEILTPDGKEVHHDQGSDPAALANALLERASPRLRALFAA